jgi:hypothetical protein
MDWIKHLVLPLTLLAIPSVQGQDIEKRAREGLAYSRLVAAHQLPTVTHGQCVSAQGDWLERDKADKKEPWWFQRLSTEELARMASLSAACGTHEGAASIGIFALRNAQFQNILLNRAETVLHDHALIEEYLLQP